MRVKLVIGIGLAAIAGLLLTLFILVWTYDVERLKPHIQAWVREATGRELAINGPMRLSPGWRMRLTVRDVSFQNAGWGTRPEMARIEELDVAVALLPLMAGRLEVSDLNLIRPDILIETDKEGRSNLEWKSAEGHGQKGGETKGVLLLPDFREVRLLDGHLSFRDGRSGATYPIQMELLALASEALNKPYQIQMKGTHRDAPFGVEGTIGSVAGILDPSLAWPLKLRGNALGAQFSVEGHIQDPLRLTGVDLAISLQAPASVLSKGAKKQGTSEPGGHYRISCRMKDSGPKEWRFSDIEVTGDGNGVSGQATLNLSRSKPKVQADLVSPRLDFRPFMALAGAPIAGKEEAPLAPKRKGKVFPDAPLGLYRLNRVDLSATLEMDTLVVPNLVLHRVKGRVVLEDGRLKLQSMKAQGGGGDVAADVEIDASGKTPTIAARLKATHVNLGSMLKEGGIQRPMEGTLTMEMNLVGRGDSIAAWMAGMNGVAVFDASHARIIGTHMGRLPGDLGTGLLLLLNPLKKADEIIAINCLVSEFHIRDGMARSNVLFLDTPAFSAAGVGWVNLATEELRFGIKPKPKQGIGSQETTRLTVGLSELARPFELTGTLAHPTLAISTTDAVLAIAKAAGGVALFGPVGLASLFVSGDFGEMDSCASARKAVGQPAPKEKKGRADDQKGSSIEEGMEKVKNAIKGLFGK